MVGSWASASSRSTPSLPCKAEGLQDIVAQSLVRLRPLMLRRSCRLLSYNGACGEVLWLNNNKIVPSLRCNSVAMVLLMYSPTVYNQSCLWSSLHSPSKSAISNASSLLSATSTQSQDWGLVLATGSSLSGYDLFRCAVVLVVTCGLISGNLILALAVNCKYSTGILQFQVRLSTFPIVTYTLYILLKPIPSFLFRLAFSIYFVCVC